MSGFSSNTALHFPRKRDAGHYVFGFTDEYETLFEVHADNIEEAEIKLAEILGLAADDPRRQLHWQDWPLPLPGDAFKYGSHRKLIVSPRSNPDPLLLPVKK